VDRKKETGEWGIEREWENVGKQGRVEWSDGEGIQRTGGEIVGRWRSGE